MSERTSCFRVRGLSAYRASLILALALVACSVEDVRFSDGDDTLPGGAVTLSVVFAGGASGQVRGDVGGLDCPGVCSLTVDAGTEVTLTAIPGAHAHLAAWSGGDCSGTAATCRLTVRSDTSVSATFELDTYPVTVMRAGSGAGSVRSTPAGLDCPGTCSHSVAHGGQVSLRAFPAPGSVFVGWASSVSDCSSAADCVLTVTAPVSLTATFAPQGALEVVKTGTGAGTVTSSPAGIDCGADCSQTYSPGQMVTLSAAASADSTFVAWSGGGCSGTGTCTITLDGAMLVTAQFMRQQRTLTVTKAGAGSGTVTSNPAGIDCGTTCSSAFDLGSMVTLSATPTMGSVFSGWSGGGCSGTGACTVTLSSATTVTATFTPLFYALTVSKAGTGSGTVTSVPAGVNCGPDCSESYAHGTMVVLNASPAAGSAFTGWAGAGCSGTGACMVTMAAANAVTATFTAQPYLVTVVRAGTGGGTVTSSPAGIDCGTDCSETVLGGSSLTLTASPAVGSSFTGWAGGGCSGTAPCTLTVTAAVNVTATFTLNTYALTIGKPGTGVGTVLSTPSGINCGGDCSEAYPHGTSVVLTAAADMSSTFAGWSGGGCTGTGTCTVTMTAATSVNATFNRNTYLLAVSKAGAGSGTVASTPAGIDCGADCSEAYPHATFVTLTATPAAGSVFSGWSGGCTGSGSCTVAMTSALSVTATFARAAYTLTVSKAGNDVGIVSSSPAGIDCGSTCSATYLHGDLVTLTATPGVFAVFAGWSGACTGTGSCTVTMTVARSVTATFVKQQYDLSVALVGSGTVTSSPAGINCGADCSELYNHGTMVTLSAAPAAGWSFSGWTGACIGTGSCTVSMVAARSVTANFSRQSFLLAVSLSGGGGGTVVSVPSGISCPGTCSASYLYGDLVTLFASPGPGSVFAGWGGACTGQGSCSVSMTAAHNVVAAFVPATYTLSVSKAGNGSGVVRSSPAGIDCGASCAATYQHGDVVTLNATSGASDVFVGWSGACSGTGPCTVTMTTARNVTATFQLQRYFLDVVVSGAGGVTSSPAGINCGGDCNEEYDAGTTVNLSASPSPGWEFESWSGACAGSAPTCAVSMTGDLLTTARFRRSSTTVTLTVQVVSEAAVGDTSVVVNGQTCDEGSTCTYQVPAGTQVTLGYNSGRYSTFDHWVGACAGFGTTCTLLLNDNASTTAVGRCSAFCP